MRWRRRTDPEACAAPAATLLLGASLEELERLERQESGDHRRRRVAVMGWVGFVLVVVGLPQAVDASAGCDLLGAVLRIGLTVAVIGIVLWLLWDAFGPPGGEPPLPPLGPTAALLLAGGWLATIEAKALVVPMGIAMAAGTRLPPRAALAIVLGCVGLTFALYGDDVGDAAGSSLGVVGSGVGTIVGRRQSLLVHRARAQRLALARGAVVDERLRIARDLHDLLGHTLLAITVKSELARQLVPVDPERARREIADVEDTARRALAEVRETVAGYRAPRLIEELDAATALARADGVELVADVGDLEGLPREVEAALGWALREAVSNVLRHAAAGRATVRIATDDRDAVLEVVDDGRGPAAGTRPAGEGGGSGLPGVRERVAALDGEVVAGAAPETGGFRLAVRVPLVVTRAGAPADGPDLAGRPDRPGPVGPARVSGAPS
jgi:two-component system sensor histidine kinase DesK